MAEFKDRFKELRMRDNLSMSKVGDKLGVGKSAIAAWESGQKFPRTPTLVDVCKLFDVSMDYLLGTSDEPLTKEHTRNLAILLSDSTDFHYNGVPLSNEDLKFFNNVLERMLKEIDSKGEENKEETKEDSSDNSKENNNSNINENKHV